MILLKKLKHLYTLSPIIVPVAFKNPVSRKLILLRNTHTKTKVVNILSREVPKISRDIPATPVSPGLVPNISKPVSGTPSKTSSSSAQDMFYKHGLFSVNKSTTSLLTNHPPGQHTFKKNMAVWLGFFVKNPSLKASTDDNGIHSQNIKFGCKKPPEVCEKLKCHKPCDGICRAVLESYNTHKPIPGSNATYKGPIDYSGNQKDQYEVKTENKNNQLSEDQLKNLTENELKPSPETTEFINK